MGIKSIGRKNVVDEVYAQMRELILSGEWPPNSKIPSENELSRAFDVSRNTIRNAIQKLKTMGVLITKQGEGSFVCGSTAENIAESFIPVICLNKKEIIEILEFRKIIEIESVGLAAIKGNEQDINTIKQYLNMMSNALQDYRQYSIADYQFHLSIAKASQNSILYSVMIKLEELIYSHLEEMNKDLGPAMSIENHKKIFNAIKDREPELARLLLKENIELSINILKSKYTS
ncbi:FadR/GntR family transcriptional regulator [Petroclostridium sp. X23]|uniref:FadR/GntR family transcriptional regulator n=1 Tax=Petroclostridium sp. X23 TaxID=3045146 RepID=UPI0024AC8314|nr:FadR/GntR family transcriptional regulator [Petroclostridium sp. X23]WHH61296.1 FadR/GntR family transcriptional regulator [Petroclostridium sp. X23]